LLPLSLIPLNSIYSIWHEKCWSNGFWWHYQSREILSGKNVSLFFIVQQNLCRFCQTLIFSNTIPSNIVSIVWETEKHVSIIKSFQNTHLFVFALDSNLKSSVRCCYCSVLHLFKMFVKIYFLFLFCFTANTLSKGTFT
jgi:hypothetical protein